MVALLSLPQKTPLLKFRFLCYANLTIHLRPNQRPRVASEEGSRLEVAAPPPTLSNKNLRYAKQTDEILGTSIAGLVLNPIASSSLDDLIAHKLMRKRRRLVSLCEHYICQKDCEAISYAIMFGRCLAYTLTKRHNVVTSDSVLSSCASHIPLRISSALIHNVAFDILCPPAGLCHLRGLPVSFHEMVKYRVHIRCTPRKS